jgi:hypothetical protein
MLRVVDLLLRCASFKLSWPTLKWSDLPSFFFSNDEVRKVLDAALRLWAAAATAGNHTEVYVAASVVELGPESATECHE